MCEDILCMLGDRESELRTQGPGLGWTPHLGNVSNHREDESTQGGSLSRRKKDTQELGEGKVSGTGWDLMCKETVSLLPLLSAVRMREIRATEKEEVSLDTAERFERNSLLPR